MAAGEKFDKDNEAFENALNQLFSKFPKNSETAHVLLKAVTLNALYSTQIPLYSGRIPTIFEVVDHIVKLGIDPTLDQGSPGVVYDIARIEAPNKGVHFNYSFATKYCSWHRPDFYPIYDSRVDEYLWHLQNLGWIEPFQRQSLKTYSAFKKRVTDFQNKYCLEQFNFKQIDKFMYYEGGKLLSTEQNELAVGDHNRIAGGPGSGSSDLGEIEC